MSRRAKAILPRASVSVDKRRYRILEVEDEIAGGDADGTKKRDAGKVAVITGLVDLWPGDRDPDDRLA